MSAEKLRVVFGDGPNDKAASPKTYDLGVEGLVVGYLVHEVDNALVADVGAVVRPEHFYSEAHRRICEAAFTLHDQGRQVDVVAVLTELRDRDRLAQVGGAAYIQELASRAVTTRAGLLEHARRVREFYVRRRWALYAQHAVTRAEQDGTSIATLLEQGRDTVQELVVELTAGEARGRVDAIAAKVVSDMVADDTPGKGVLPTGFPSIDHLTSGLPIDLAVLAGMPGEAKTSLATAIGMNVARRGGGVFIASLETQREELFTRMAAADAGVSMRRAVAGELTKGELPRFLQACRELSPLPIFIEHDSMSPRELYARIRSAKLALAAEAKPGVAPKRLRLVIVDYLQIVPPPARRENRSEEIADITRALKNIAIDLRISVLAISQLNESKVEQRKGGRPQIGDLFGSSELRKCARLVLALHRPDAHPSSKNYTPTGIAEVEVLKNNKGPKGGIAELKFEATSASFEDIFGQPARPTQSYTCSCGARLEAGRSCACGATSTPAAHASGCRCTDCDPDDTSLIPPGHE